MANIIREVHLKFVDPASGGIRLTSSSVVVSIETPDPGDTLHPVGGVYSATVVVEPMAATVIGISLVNLNTGTGAGTMVAAVRTPGTTTWTVTFNVAPGNLGQPLSLTVYAAWASPTGPRYGNGNIQPFTCAP